MANRKQRASIRGRGSMSVALKGNDPRQRRNPQAGTRGEDYKPPLYVENAAGTNGRALRRLELRTGSDFTLDSLGRLSLISTDTTFKTHVGTASINAVALDASNTAESVIHLSDTSTANTENRFDLPKASESAGFRYRIKWIADHGTGTATKINPFASELIEGDPNSLVMGRVLDALYIVCDGTEWWLI